MKKLDVGVIGLGAFGSAVAKAITALGHRVVGVDIAPQAVKRLKDSVAQAYSADATDAEVLKQLRFLDLDTVVVSVGESMEASILTVLNLQEMGIRNIAVKAMGGQHAAVLKRLGVPIIARPELDAAEQLAHRLSNPGMLDLLPLGGDVLLQELDVERWQGKTLEELNLTALKVMVVAIKHVGESQYAFVPDAEKKLEEGDVLIVIGAEKQLLKLEP